MLVNNRFTSRISKSNFSHAYLVVGNNKVQESFVKHLIDELNIHWVDIYSLNSLESIKIKEIRQIEHQINLKPHSSKHKLIIINNGQNLTLEASNALLKTLEEPPINSIIIICVSNENALLPTLISRCQKIKIRDTSVVNPSENEIVELKNIFKLSIKEKFALSEKLSKKQDINDILDRWLIILRQEMLGKNINPILIKKFLNYKKMLKTNVNNRLVLDNLFLEIK